MCHDYSTFVQCHASASNETPFLQKIEYNKLHITCDGGTSWLEEWGLACATRRLHAYDVSCKSGRSILICFSAACMRDQIGDHMLNMLKGYNHYIRTGMFIIQQEAIAE